MENKTIIAGNWKMNTTVQEAVDLANKIKESSKVKVIISPPFVSLDAVQNVIKDKSINLAAQNLHEEEKGAFTGETSAEMIKTIGCEYVIIGHSERRHIFGETNTTINKKIKTALSHNLKVIFCVGETKEEKEQQKTNDILKKQLEEGLEGINTENIIIAYEPVWAIGTGLTATPKEAESSHQFIRSQVPSTAILYGGSVKPDNVKELLSQEHIDGVLAGGASLKAESFNQMIEIAETI